MGTFGSKLFRPEAPEFVPSYHRSYAVSKMHPTGSVPTNIHSFDGADGRNVEKRKSRREKERERKRKQDPSITEPNLGSSSEVSSKPPVPANETSTQDDDTTPKRPRHGRRNQAKSEPSLSQTDGFTDVDGGGGAVGYVDGQLVFAPPTEGHPLFAPVKTVRNTNRRVTAPSDPHSTTASTSNSRRRQRPKHWRVKNRDTSGTDGGSAATQRTSSGEGGNWSSETKAAAMEWTVAAPVTSPATGVVPSNGNELVGGSGRVRFVPGV